MWFRKKKNKKGGQYFSRQWMNQWKKAINTSEAYQHHGKNWNAPIIIKIDPPPDYLLEKQATGIFLHLSYGECTEIKYSTDKDEPSTDIILRANEAAWIRLIEEKVDPTNYLMMGKISLEKGSLVLLSTQRKAAAALMNSAPSQNASSDALPATARKRHKKKVDRKKFKTTTGGLDHTSYPLQLFQKSKQFGVWNPSDINFSKDREQWSSLTIPQKEILVHLFSLFIAGEEAVTSDLLPLIKVIAGEGRVEEEIYLTSFLWEEAKHVEFFSLFKNSVLGNSFDFNTYHKSFYRVIFYEKLPDALQNLDHDSSPRSVLKASITYHMIVEGTLAETGYAAFYKMLDENSLLPGLREGIQKLKQDESRHIAFGLYLINRILEENPDLKNFAEEELTTLLDDTTNIIHEIFEPYDVVPFGLKKEWFLNYAIKQFQARVSKIGLDRV